MTISTSFIMCVIGQIRPGIWGRLALEQPIPAIFGGFIWRNYGFILDLYFLVSSLCCYGNLPHPPQIAPSPGRWVVPFSFPPTRSVHTANGGRLGDQMTAGHGRRCASWAAEWLESASVTFPPREPPEERRSKQDRTLVPGGDFPSFIFSERTFTHKLKSCLRHRTWAHLSANTSGKASIAKRKCYLLLWHTSSHFCLSSPSTRRRFIFFHSSWRFENWVQPEPFYLFIFFLCR